MLYSYYTAGSGGVGPTILETSLLLAGTPVTVYANGEKVRPSPTHGGVSQVGIPVTCSVTGASTDGTCCCCDCLAGA